MGETAVGRCPPTFAVGIGQGAASARLLRDSLASVSLDDTDLFGAAASAGDGVGGGGGIAAHRSRCGCGRASIDEVRGQGDVLRPGSPLRRLIEGSGGAAGPISAILWGPPGTGKTTLAHLVATAADREFVELSAVTAGVKDVRAVMEHANRARDMYGRQTVLFLDEIHRFTKAQQDALLPGVENRQVVLVAATTENPSFSVIAPLLSPLDADHPRAAHRRRRRRRARPPRWPTRAASTGRTRSTTTPATTSCGSPAATPAGRSPSSRPPPAWPTTPSPRAPTGRMPCRSPCAQSEQAVAHAAVRYDRTGDQHYDVASALIKSMRGSDVDAALHYLARMLEAGEDPRFIARRVVIAASEDVGLADPTALQTAVAAMHAVAQIGMPEARIILAQAVVHNALAPEVERRLHRHQRGDRRRARRQGRPGAGPPARQRLRGRRPPRARQGLRLRPRRAGCRRRPAVPARRPGRADRLLPPHRPRLRGPAAGALDLAQGAARPRLSR